MGHKKKSFNPLKMWGSYVGALVVGIPWTLYVFLVTYVSSAFGGSSVDSIELLFVSSLGIIIGFLVGWGVHSLIRVVRKRKG